MTCSRYPFLPYYPQFTLSWGLKICTSLLLFALCIPYSATPQEKNEKILAAREFQVRANEFFTKMAYDSSAAYFEMARVVWEKNGVWEEVIGCNNRVGDILIRKGEFGPALACLNTSLKLGKEKLPPDHLRMGQTYKLLGFIHNYRQEYDRAIQYFRDELRIEKTSGKDEAEIPRCLYLLASAYNSMGNYDDALKSIGEALELTRRKMLQDDIAMDLLVLANIR